MGNLISFKNNCKSCLSPPCADSYLSLDDGNDDIQDNTHVRKHNPQSQFQSHPKNYNSTTETMSNPYSLTQEDFTVAEISTCDFCKNKNIKVHRIQTIGNEKNYYLVCRACNNICNNEIYI